MRHHRRPATGLREQNLHEKRDARRGNAQNIEHRHGLGSDFHDTKVVGDTLRPVDIRDIKPILKLEQFGRVKGKRGSTLGAARHVELPVAAKRALAVGQHVDCVEILEPQLGGTALLVRFDC